MNAPLAELIADLAEAGVGGRTRTALVRRVAEALARTCALQELELGWCDPRVTRSTFAVATLEQGDWEVREGSKSLRRTHAQRAVRAALPTTTPQTDGISEGPPWVVLLPLVTGAGAPGYARLRLGASLPAGLIASLHPLGRVLRVAQQNCSLISRVASVSRQAHASNARLRNRVNRLERVPRVVAKSPAMRTAIERLDAVSEHDSTVLLLGESGTGKSLLAKRVHARSPRAAEAFVAVNCGALPDTLIESELFGHAAGAFTGASKPRAGRFERARGGTLFLDEVGELPPTSQVKLLRALQEGVIEPLGSEREVRVDVRVVAATNQPLAQRVEEGTFRADLYYRLSVFPVTVPSLRERPEDLPELVLQLLAEVSGRLRMELPSISQASLRTLMKRSWAGNVRELANVLERSVILSKGKRLELEPEDAPSPSLGTRDQDDVLTFDAAVRACIERALQASRGKLYGKGGAAAALGLNPSTLQTKMRKLGISRDAFVPG